MMGFNPSFLRFLARPELLPLEAAVGVPASGGEGTPFIV
jgi:hypothetical protein